VRRKIAWDALDPRNVYLNRLYGADCDTDRQTDRETDGPTDAIIIM